jgi:hypothetical protein
MAKSELPIWSAILILAPNSDIPFPNKAEPFLAAEIPLPTPPPKPDTAPEAVAGPFRRALPPAS